MQVSRLEDDHSRGRKRFLNENRVMNRIERIGITAFTVALVMVCVLLRAWPQDLATPGDHKQTIEVGSLTRSYIVRVPPAYDGKKPLPLVFVIHGGGGNAEGTPKMSGMSDKADKEGFIAVYPNGTGAFKDRLLTWNSGNCCAYARNNNVDDVSFFRAILDKLEKTYTIDSKRIYATGISNGAMMSYRLAFELSGKFAAIAPVAGAMNLDDPKPTSSVSVIIFHGTDDEHVLYQGGKPKKNFDPHERIDRPVSYAVSFWTKHDSCTSKPKREENETFVKETYGNGKDDTEIVLYTVKGGGHAWFGKYMGWPWEGKAIKGISCTDLIWEFFKTHPKK